MLGTSKLAGRRHVWVYVLRVEHRHSDTETSTAKQKGKGGLHSKSALQTHPDCTLQTETKQEEREGPVSHRVID